MRILAIETSCDDTGVAIVDIEKQKNSKFPNAIVVANLILSQTALHAKWGGVVPNLAKNAHVENLPKLWGEIVSRFTFHVSRPNFITVTVGPGLEPSLWAGIEFAKKIGDELKIPVIGANHLEGHMYSFLLPQRDGRPMTDDRRRITEANTHHPSSIIRHPSPDIPRFPAVVLLVSGGNTMLMLMKNITSWHVLGKTKDDAVGEAFDKVARMLGLPYPGGPAIEQVAKKGNPNAIAFPRPLLREKNYDFSFSGLKTSVLYYLQKNTNVRSPTTDDRSESVIRHPSSVITDVAASFQAAAIEVLVKKTERAVVEFGARAIVLCGGVAANTALRNALQKSAENFDVTFIAPAMEYNTDNAAMIAMAAYMRTARKSKPLPLVADGTLSL